MIQAMTCGVGVHVGRGDVAVGADHVADLGGEASGQALELARDERLGSHVTPPLAPPYGILTHAHFQVIRMARARTLVQVGLRVKAHAALGRAAGHVVPDAIAGEDAARAIVQLHREVHGDLALGVAQHLAHGRAQVELVGGAVVLVLGDRPRRALGGCRVYRQGGGVDRRLGAGATQVGLSHRTVRCSSPSRLRRPAF